MYSAADIRQSLHDFCCEEADFMWRNALLAPRVETEFSAGPEGLWMTFLKGFRVRRTFMWFSRDLTLYECPFCRASWVHPLGYRDHLHGIEGGVVFASLPRGRIGTHRLPRSLFLQALADTKRRCKHWPPQD